MLGYPETLTELFENRNKFSRVVGTKNFIYFNTQLHIRSMYEIDLFYELNKNETHNGLILLFNHLEKALYVKKVSTKQASDLFRDELKLLDFKTFSEHRGKIFDWMITWKTKSRLIPLRDIMKL